jgi:hypothetical protein
MLDDEGASVLVIAAVLESMMKVGYVVPYADDAEACRMFWIEPVGRVENRRTVLARSDATGSR